MTITLYGADGNLQNSKVFVGGNKQTVMVMIVVVNNRLLIHSKVFPFNNGMERAPGNERENARIFKDLK